MGQNRKILIYTVHKAATTFIQRLTKETCTIYGLRHHSMSNGRQPLLRGHGWSHYVKQVKGADCFGPIRMHDSNMSPVMKSNDPPCCMPILRDPDLYKVILHLRDPRDVLTSAFFSHLYSHGRNPGGFNMPRQKVKNLRKMGIDGYIKQLTPKIKQRYKILCTSLLGEEGVVLLKYEDMVTNYGEWLNNFLGPFRQPKHLNNISLQATKALKETKAHRPKPPNHRAAFNRLYNRHKNDFKIKEEDIYRHKRQISPGDHKRKLTPKTIEFLNNEFGEILDLLNYA